MATRAKNPATREEWQHAVDLAEVMILMHSAACYGLIVGIPVINVSRCEWILEHGRRRGFVPAPDCVETIICRGQGMPVLMQGGSERTPPPDPMDS